MPSRILLSLSLLFLTWSGAGAQTADDFFHGGAQHYLSNNIPDALQTVTNGLQRFPDDAKLKKLYELLNQQQQQQDQQNQKDQKQDPQKDQKQDPKKKDEQKQQPAKDDQPKQDKEQKAAPNKKSQDKKDQQQAKSSDKSKGKPDEPKETGEPQPVAAHAMTPQEAKQLLDAQKGDEQVLQFVPQVDPKNQSKPLKDW